jgi:hypothetical protein
MRRMAYLTMDDETGWQIDNHLAFGPLEALGWHIERVRWRSAGTDWDTFAAVYIGAPWDYPEDPRRFLQLLDTVDRSRAVLVNDMALVRWTLSKTYLRDLEERGIRIVPSRWGAEMSHDIVAEACSFFRSDKIIIKPVISTNATDTFLLERAAIADAAGQLAETFADRAFVIQPFIDTIQADGEYSLFYFNRAFSHAIRKLPARGDFRVQEEFGAGIESVEPPLALVAAGDAVMRQVQPLPVYARCDFVRARSGQYLLMELELIEPSLYLRTDDAAPARFAAAFDDYMQTASGENRA